MSAPSTPTEELFRDDSYLKTCTAKVVGVGRGASGRGVELDRTVFYPTGGGQPGDGGVLALEDGREIIITEAVKDKLTGAIFHIAEEGAVMPGVGEAVSATIDWEQRHKLMRMHTFMHILSALVDGGITGCQAGVAKSRVDFNLPESPDKEKLNAEINRIISENHSVGNSWISDDELDSNPELVRSLSVAPPRGGGRIRVINIDGVDLQPCGGTHVKSTAEIGPVRIGKIENKGKQNRRINIHFAD